MRSFGPTAALVLICAGAWSVACLGIALGLRALGVLP